SSFGEKFQTLLQTVDQRGWASACFPCKRAAIPTLRKVSIIIRIRNTDPADERWLYSLAGAIRKIKEPDTLGSQQPFVTGAGSNINQLRLNINGNYAQRLNDIDDQQGINSARCKADTFKVGSESGRILHLANCHQSRFGIDQSNQFIQIDSAVALLRHAHFDAESLAKSQPRINVGGEFIPERYQI